jgi:hypothetical protein
MWNGLARFAFSRVGSTAPHWLAALVGFVLAQWLLWSSWHGGGMPPASHAEQFWAGIIGAVAGGMGWEGIIRLFRLLKGSVPSKPPEHGAGQ